jgi:hypothetical protein
MNVKISDTLKRIDVDIECVDGIRNTEWRMENGGWITGKEKWKYRSIILVPQ